MWILLLLVGFTVGLGVAIVLNASFLSGTVVVRVVLFIKELTFWGVDLGIKLKVQLLSSWR